MIKSKVAALAFLTTYQTNHSVFGIYCSYNDPGVFKVDPIGVRHESLDRIHGGENRVMVNRFQKV